MTKFFFVITKDRDALAFELMLKTGPREQELANLEWGHLEFWEDSHGQLQDAGQFPHEDRKSRTIPLERGLADRLAEWQREEPHFHFWSSHRDGQGGRSLPATLQGVRETVGPARGEVLATQIPRHPSPLGHYGAAWTSAPCSIGWATPALR